MRRFVFGLTALILAASTSFAGKRFPVTASGNVTIARPPSRYAYGTLSAARNSTNSNEWISCQIYTFNGTAYTWGVCSFVDAIGNGASCITTNPAFLTILETLSGDANLTVGWDQSGVCSNVQVTTDSGYGPKVPDAPVSPVLTVAP